MNRLSVHNEELKEVDIDNLLGGGWPAEFEEDLIIKVNYLQVTSLSPGVPISMSTSNSHSVSTPTSASIPFSADLPNHLLMSSSKPTETLDGPEHGPGGEVDQAAVKTATHMDKRLTSLAIGIIQELNQRKKDSKMALKDKSKAFNKEKLQKLEKVTLWRILAN